VLEGIYDVNILKMNDRSCWVVDYLVVYICFIILICIDGIRVQGIYLSTLVLIALILIMQLVCRFSMCFCMYHHVTRCRERRRQRHLAESRRVREVIERAKTAYLEQMTDD